MHIARRNWSACLWLAGMWLFGACASGFGGESPAAEADKVARLADLIDRHVAAKWEAGKVTPADRADDAEFLRRVSLDVSGKIPPVSRIREFLADTSPDKRRKVVDELLESPGYIVNFTNVWRKVLMPEADTSQQLRFLVPGFEAWLRQHFARNTPYDVLVTELLTIPLELPRDAGPRRGLNRLGEASAVAFYQGKQIAPENLAASTSRMFLGIRIECAQCHDHPFDVWKRDEFWGYAAFFAGIERAGDDGFVTSVREIEDRREMLVPQTERVVQAAYLGGAEPQWRYDEPSRTTLARWIASADNPYFSRTAVNRLWGHFFGIGIVDPVDDFGGANEPSHPELLDALAREFSSHRFDLKHLIRGITASRTYQLSSRRTHASQDQPRVFARTSTRRMTSEQLSRSLSQALGIHRPYDLRQAYSFEGDEFAETFANDSEAPTQQTTTILQALSLMNGDLTRRGTDPISSETLAALVQFPMTNAERIEALYLATLSRPPRPDEAARMLKHIEARTAAGNDLRSGERRALSDVLWALLNSTELLLNL